MGFFLRHQIERCFAEHFLWFVSKDVKKFSAAVGKRSMLIDFPNPVACRFHQVAKPLFALLQSQFCVLERLRRAGAICPCFRISCTLGARGKTRTCCLDGCVASERRADGRAGCRLDLRFA